MSHRGFTYLYIAAIAQTCADIWHGTLTCEAPSVLRDKFDVAKLRTSNTLRQGSRRTITWYENAVEKTSTDMEIAFVSAKLICLRSNRSEH